jgi:hypothetical protein
MCAVSAFTSTVIAFASAVAKESGEQRRGADHIPAAPPQRFDGQGRDVEIRQEAQGGGSSGRPEEMMLIGGQPSRILHRLQDVFILQLRVRLAHVRD